MFWTFLELAFKISPFRNKIIFQRWHSDRCHIGSERFRKIMDTHRYHWFSKVFRGAMSIPNGSDSSEFLAYGLEPPFPDLVVGWRTFLGVLTFCCWWELECVGWIRGIYPLVLKPIELLWALFCKVVAGGLPSTSSWVILLPPAKFIFSATK